MSARQSDRAVGVGFCPRCSVRGRRCRRRSAPRPRRRVAGRRQANRAGHRRPYVRADHRQGSRGDAHRTRASPPGQGSPIPMACAERPDQPAAVSNSADAKCSPAPRYRLRGRGPEPRCRPPAPPSPTRGAPVRLDHVVSSANSAVTVMLSTAAGISSSGLAPSSARACDVDRGIDRGDHRRLILDPREQAIRDRAVR